MTGNRELSPYEQLRSLRRQLWVLVGIWMIVTALVGAWAVSSSKWSSKVSLQITDESALAVGAGLPNVLPERTAGAEAAVLADDPVLTELADSENLVLTATPLEIADTVQVRASSNDRDVDVQLGKVLDSYLDRRRQSTIDLLQSVIPVRENRIEQINQRLTEISAVLADPGSISTNSLDSLQLERLRTLGDLTQMQGELAALKQLVQSTTGGVVANGPPSSPSQGATGSLKLIAAALLGLIVAVGVGLVRTRVDRRLRSVNDIESVAPHVPVFGMVTVAKGPDEQRQALVARAIRNRARAVGADSILVYPVSRLPSSAALELAALLEAEESAEDFKAVTPDTSVGSPAPAALLNEDFDAVVLTVSAGKDRREELASAVHQVEAVGTTLLGVVLTDVAPPDQTLAYASRAQADA